MKSLIYLTSLKAKAYLRKIFSKPSSAIFTILGLIFFVGIFFLMRFSYGEISELVPYEIFVILFLVALLFMTMIQLFQKRQALFNIQDANYLLVGPYHKKELLIYALMTSVTNALVYSFMTYVYAVCFFGPLFEIYWYDYFVLFLVAFIFFMIVFTLIDGVYLHYINNKRQRIIRILIYTGVIGIILSVFIYYYFTNSFNNLTDAVLSFIVSDLFNYTPIIGWANMALTNLHNGHYLLFLVGLGLNIGALALGILYVLSTKEIDNEKVLDDATYFAELRQKAKENNSNINLNLKVKKVNKVSFKEGAKAISSRMLLDMRKTNSFITKQELLFILIYFGIAYFNNYEFIWYSRYVTIILFMVTMSANYLDELKHHYIYLIPDSPSKKLLALIKPTILKVFIFVLVMNTVGIVFKPTLFEYFSALFETFGYGLLFITGNILCTRILKSNENAVANQFIKMGVILVILLVSIACGTLSAIFIDMRLYSFISSIVSILLSSLILYLSKGLVSGIEFNAN